MCFVIFYGTLHCFVVYVCKYNILKILIKTLSNNITINLFRRVKSSIMKLKNFMKVICERGGLKGNYTNHSGKRSCATQLYMAGVDEQEIMA